MLYYVFVVLLEGAWLSDRYLSQVPGGAAQVAASLGHMCLRRLPLSRKRKNRSSSLPRRMCNVRPEYDFLWLVLPFIDGPRFVWDFWENHTLMNILPETFNCGCSVLRSALPFLRLVYSKASTC